ncbi:uncharacterized protein BJ212DRAFT_1576961 [Suillus subaureus]|uniref:Uncharacterized protein n=1 Tax=Suillus subaureus TaxID=48587 RepID=A0A9P7EBX2_9AGAM|nr:uncharacterized protein BJ212DRAFT_1576961 [Suillus subaureus]KAG1816803.1 hypothetical protein BJ212DRAFT_1576961 [Suillus subaureus]
MPSTYLLPVMNDVVPPALDSRRVTRELTTRLCSKDHLLHGIDDIMKFEHSEDYELQRYGRKIISLIEVARSTLKRLQVELYLFVACSVALLPFKSAYFKLLLFIERRKHAFGSDLDKRISRLLDPLYSRFVVCYGGVDPRAQLGIKGLPAPPDIPATWKSTIHPVVPGVSSAQRQEDVASDIMLSPDAFARKKARLDRLGEFIKEQSAKKFSRGRGLPMLEEYPAGNSGEKRLVPRQYATGNPEEMRLVPKQYATGNPEEWRLVPKQYAMGSPEERPLVPKQCATGGLEERRLVPKQYPTGNPEERRLVPKQYATGNPQERRLAPKQYAVGKPGAKRLVPQQYPAGKPGTNQAPMPKYSTARDDQLGNNVKPSCPGRALTRTYAQYFDDV